MQYKGGLLFGFSLLLALCLMSVLASSAFEADGGTTGVNLSEKPGTISVNGNGIVYTEPDIAKITVGVITEAGTSTQAMADNANKMDSVVNSVKGKGIPAKDIKTATISVEPEYASENPPPASLSYPVPAKQNISGYKATNTITVTIRDLTLAGAVIDAASAAGSNEIQGVSFQLSDELQSRVYDDALKKAIADGTDKAQTIATAAGITGYKLKSISESGSRSPVYAYEGMGGAAMAKAASAPTPVSAGQTKVEATVSMTYIFVPQ